MHAEMAWQRGWGVAMRMARISRVVAASGVMAAAIFDLTGSLPAGLAAAFVALGLGALDLLPFAAAALPTLAALAAICIRLWPELGLEAAAATVRLNAEQMAAVIAAQLPRPGE